MKTVLMLILLCALACKTDLKQEVSSVQGPSIDASATSYRPEEKGPRITFEQTRQSFGEIWHAEKSKHQYVFTNTGDRDLLIKHARASCGCTKPSYSKDPVAPGEKGIIHVTFNSVGKQGSQRARIWVVTNDPTRPEVELKLTGRIKVKPKAEYDKEQAAKKRDKQ